MLAYTAIPCLTTMNGIFSSCNTLVNPIHHYKAENLKFTKMHKKALTFKACKRILTEFMLKATFSSISGV